MISKLRLFEQSALGLVLMAAVAGNAWAEQAAFGDDFGIIDASLVACDDLAEAPCIAEPSCEWVDDQCRYRQAAMIDLGVDGASPASPLDAQREAGPPAGEAGVGQGDAAAEPSEPASDDSSGCLQTGSSHTAPVLLLVLLFGLRHRRR